MDRDRQEENRMQRRRMIGGLIIALSIWLGAVGTVAIRADEPVPYETEGTVLELMPEQGLILIDHEPIRAPGYFMGAMEMPFSVENPALLSGLKSGDRIRFRVSVEKKSRIVELKKLP
jgi:Cu/Ag efflux protein CusF